MIRRNQSGRNALIETVTDKTLGAVIATVSAMLYFNLAMKVQGVTEVTLEASTLFTVIMFVLAVGRGWLLRLLFDRLPVIKRLIRRRRSRRGM